MIKRFIKQMVTESTESKGRPKNKIHHFLVCDSKTPNVTAIK